VNLMMSSCRSCTETNHLVFLLFSFLTGCWSFCSLSLSLLKKVALVLKSLMKMTQKERLKLYDVGCLISLVQLIFS
jgi:hypothetical protein